MCGQEIADDYWSNICADCWYSTLDPVGEPEEVPPTEEEDK